MSEEKDHHDPFSTYINGRDFSFGENPSLSGLVSALNSKFKEPPEYGTIASRLPSRVERQAGQTFIENVVDTIFSDERYRQSWDVLATEGIDEKTGMLLVATQYCVQVYILSKDEPQEITGLYRIDWVADSPLKQDFSDFFENITIYQGGGTFFLNKNSAPEELEVHTQKWLADAHDFVQQLGSSSKLDSLVSMQKKLLIRGNLAV